MPEPRNPQALNRYAYVYNNPARYTDPSGHEIPWPLCVFCDKKWDITNWGWLGINAAALVGFPFGFSVSYEGDPWHPDTGKWYLNSLSTEAWFAGSLAPATIESGSIFEYLDSSIGRGIAKAEQAQLIVGNTTADSYALATIADGSIITHSGQSERISTTLGTQQGLQLADEMDSYLGIVALWTMEYQVNGKLGMLKFNWRLLPQMNLWVFRVPCAENAGTL